MNKHRLYFEEQHTAIEDLLMEHLLAVVGADFAHAQQLYQQWQVALLAHIRIENEQLLPHIPEGARWAEKIYRLEHDRIALLAEEYADRLQLVLDKPPLDAQATRRASLYLLDKIHSLRHVIEHHHEREHTALAEELSPSLQAQVWSGIDPLGACRT